MRPDYGTRIEVDGTSSIGMSIEEKNKKDAITRIFEGHPFILFTHEVIVTHCIATYKPEHLPHLIRAMLSVIEEMDRKKVK